MKAMPLQVLLSSRVLFGPDELEKLFMRMLCHRGILDKLVILEKVFETVTNSFVEGNNRRVKDSFRWGRETGAKLLWSWQPGSIEEEWYSLAFSCFLF